MEINMFNKKSVIALSVVLVGAIAYLFYSQSQAKTPPKQTSCEILVGNILDAKTQLEKDFARERWQVLCDKDKP